MAAGTVSLRYFILGLLAQQSMSGYDIRRFMKSLSWLIDSPSYGSLYPALHTLLEDGLVTVEVIPREDKPPRKIYSITSTGRQVLDEWLHQPLLSSASSRAFVMRLLLSSHLNREGLAAQGQLARSQPRRYGRLRGRPVRLGRGHPGRAHSPTGESRFSATWFRSRRA